MRPTRIRTAVVVSATVLGFVVGGTTLAFAGPSKTTISFQQTTYSVTEGTAPAGGTLARLVLLRTGDLSSGESVTCQLVTGSSTPGFSAASDIFPSGTTTWTAGFGPGDKWAFCDVLLAPDSSDEVNEVAAFNLIDNTHVAKQKPLAYVTVVDDDLAGTLTQQANKNIAAPEDYTPFAFPITFTQGSNGWVAPVTVSYRTLGGTAFGQATGGSSCTAGVDFVSQTGTWTFYPAGGSPQTKTINVPICNDAIDEPNELFAFEISNPVNADIGFGEEVVNATITDNDNAPKVSIGDATAAEDTGTWNFPVSLSGPTAQDIVVTWATDSNAGSTAYSIGDPLNTCSNAGTDYVSATGTLTFLAGSSTPAPQDVSISVCPDSKPEKDDTFNVVLIGTGYADWGDLSALGTIVNDDSPTVFIEDATAWEGSNLNFEVKLSQAHEKTVTVKVDTVTGGTASQGSDYTPKSETLTFVPGDTVETFSVVTKENSTPEPNEIVWAVLSEPVNAILGDSGADGTIKDDDPYSVALGDVQTIADTSDATLVATVKNTDGDLLNGETVRFELYRSRSAGSFWNLRDIGTDLGVGSTAAYGGAGFAVTGSGMEVGGAPVTPADGAAVFTYPSPMDRTTDARDLIVACVVPGVAATPDCGVTTVSDTNGDPYTGQDMVLGVSSLNLPAGYTNVLWPLI